MNVPAAIRAALPVLVQYGHVDRVVLRAWLVRYGLTNPQALAVIRFVPLAFGREVMNGMGVQFPETYVRVVGEHREERALADEPFFREAVALAPQLPRDAVTTIALQSAELQALNAALHGGANPQDLVAGPPVIEFEPNEREATPRAWWKFW